MASGRKKNLLSAKQKKFCDEYLKDANGFRAAVAAGFSENGAGVTASRLLKNPNVQSFLSAKAEKVSHMAELTAEKVLRDIEEIKQLAKAANDFGPALKATELQGKFLSLWKDRTEISGPDGGPVKTETQFNINFVKPE